MRGRGAHDNACHKPLNGDLARQQRLRGVIYICREEGSGGGGLSAAGLRLTTMTPAVASHHTARVATSARLCHHIAPWTLQVANCVGTFSRRDATTPKVSLVT